MIDLSRRYIRSDNIRDIIGNLIAYHLTKPEGELVYIVKRPIYVKVTKDHYIEVEY